MDAKITLSFDEQIIIRAKKFAEENNISLSRLMELLLSKLTAKKYNTIEELPISDWVQMVSEGQIEYKTPKRNRKKIKEEFFKSKK